MDAGFLRAVTLVLSDTYGPDDRRPKVLNLVRNAVQKVRRLRSLTAGRTMTQSTSMMWFEPFGWRESNSSRDGIGAMRPSGSARRLRSRSVRLRSKYLRVRMRRGICFGDSGLPLTGKSERQSGCIRLFPAGCR